jgi:anti-sigma factor RsiW
MAAEPCRDLLGQLSDYVDGELDPELCRALEAHMAGCDNCRTVVDTLSETVHLYHALPPATVSATISARLRSALGLAPDQSTTDPNP